MKARDRVTTLPSALADRAEASPDDPWLFYREGFDWRWRSWSQVAHQAALGARLLRRSGRLEQGGRMAYGDRLHPDSIAAVLAIQAAGGLAVPVAADEEAEVPELPPVASRLGRWRPDLDSLRAALRDDAGAFGGGHGEPRTHRELWRAAAAWSAGLPAVEEKPRKRAIALASGAVAAEMREIFLAWTLATGSAWVLEDDADFFVPAALRNRPTMVAAPGSEAGLLALSLGERRHRRWCRLRAVGITDDAPAEIFLEEEWDALGVPVVRLLTLWRRGGERDSRAATGPRWRAD